MALEIYWASGSPFAWRVLMTAELKDVPYVSKQLQFSKKEHKAAAYFLTFQDFSAGINMTAD